MTLSQSVCEVLRAHVVLESECIDRMYLNVYVPQLQRVGGVVWYLRGHLGQRFASTATVAPKTVAFVASIEKFVAEQGVDLVSFGRHQRKDDITQQYLQRFDADEGILYGCRAQEKARVVRTERRCCARTGMGYPWVDGSAMVSHYYFYCVDDDFGPFFLKFCSYFPYNAKLCINGNEYAKCQLRKRGIAFEALDNGILSCEDPKALQVLDRLMTGRIFFLGRTGQVQLIFDRRVNRRTPGRFRTRVITEGVTPSLHVDYKRSRIKRYHNEGQSLRTETTINDTRDVGVGRLLRNLPELRRIGFAVNRRMLEIEQLSHDRALGEDAFQGLQRARHVDGQRAPALRFADPKDQALLRALVMFIFVARGFTNQDLRQAYAVLLGLHPGEIGPGRMSYELRCLRLHGLIQPVPKTHRYRLTKLGLQTALFYTRVYSLRPGLALVSPQAPAESPASLQRSFRTAERAVNTWRDQVKIAA
ncbi:hypothetical protein AWB81_07041 [Caballeronia arationis]|uniref:hypothetical protein n=1 Tax=Caballeronia arationis TaxID=1777142 RepID=UPI00074C881A|nr:hypothetical protein [Caballeronia arationis]SAL05155.1 hypothetical protein AWB81_07041 [Caballeronia arationis]